MQIKEIFLTAKIPAAYKYMAKQPWGSIVLFKDKPKIRREFIGTNLKKEEVWGEYWDTQPDEIEIENFSDWNKDPNWKYSLQPI